MEICNSLFFLTLIQFHCKDISKIQNIFIPQKSDDTT